MSYSSLISGYLLSPNCTKPRNHSIDRITPHYMAAYSTAKSCCEWFCKKSTRASANYCIGYDGEIWLCVNEDNRAWTTGSAYNDNRAVTIECANLSNGRLPDATWASLVKLCDTGPTGFTLMSNVSLSQSSLIDTTLRKFPLSSPFVQRRFLVRLKKVTLPVSMVLSRAS